jgi:hypothetical protein
MSDGHWKEPCTERTRTRADSSKTERVGSDAASFALGPGFFTIGDESRMYLPFPGFASADRSHSCERLSGFSSWPWRPSRCSPSWLRRTDGGTAVSRCAALRRSVTHRQSLCSQSLLCSASSRLLMLTVCTLRSGRLLLCAGCAAANGDCGASAVRATQRIMRGKGKPLRPFLPFLAGECSCFLP